VSGHPSFAPAIARPLTGTSSLGIPTAGELKRTYLMPSNVASRPSNGLFFFLLSENRRSVFQSLILHARKWQFARIVSRKFVNGLGNEKGLQVRYGFCTTET